MRPSYKGIFGTLISDEGSLIIETVHVQNGKGCHDFGIKKNTKS